MSSKKVHREFYGAINEHAPETRQLGTLLSFCLPRHDQSRERKRHQPHEEGRSEDITLTQTIPASKECFMKSPPLNDAPLTAEEVMKTYI